MTTRAQAFLWRRLAAHAVGAGVRLVRGNHRTPASVRARYDAARRSLLYRIERLDWDQYTRLPSDHSGFILIDGRVVWGSLRTIRDRMLDRLCAVTAGYARDGATIVEFGSGDGRNLLFLQRRFPKVSFVGLELSEVSVEVSRRAAERFAVPNVRFHVADVCGDVPALPQREEVVLSFSCFALEMMPRIFPRAVDTMARASSVGLVFLEPVPELWRRDLRGLVSRLRVLQLDRLRGLPLVVQGLVRSGSWILEAMARSGLGHNPLNEMCELRLRRVTPGVDSDG